MFVLRRVIEPQEPQVSSDTHGLSDEFVAVLVEEPRIDESIPVDSLAEGAGGDHRLFEHRRSIAHRTVEALADAVLVAWFCRVPVLTVVSLTQPEVLRARDEAFEVRCCWYLLQSLKAFVDFGIKLGKRLARADCLFD